MAFVKRLSIGTSVAEPLAHRVDLGLGCVGSATFDVRAEKFPDVQTRQTCRLYVGASDKVTFLLFQGLVSEVDSPRAGVARIVARQRCAALEGEQSISLPNCTAMHVLQELADATDLPFATALPGDPGNAYLTTAIPHYSSQGPMCDALNGLGATFGVTDAVWYEQPDGRIFWGSWGRTPMAQTPLPLQDNIILEQAAGGRAVRIPLVASLRPGMRIQTPDREFRIDKLHLEGDTMRLEWGGV